MASDFQGQSCGIYPRVSTIKQAKKDRSSLKDQENACRDYARVLLMDVDEACVKPEAYTSTKLNRPELNQLLAEMKARHVPNLIIDRVDRTSRAGLDAAYTFLRQFHESGITLHIVSMGHEEDTDDDDDGAERAKHALVIRKHDQVALKAFFDAAFSAYEDNKKRTRIVKRAKHSYALAGRYLRGSRAPYGYRYEPCEYDGAGNVIDKCMVPDEKPFAERGFITTFAPNPYAARQKMLRL